MFDCVTDALIHITRIMPGYSDSNRTNLLFWSVIKQNLPLIPICVTNGRNLAAGSCSFNPWSVKTKILDA
ncbi:hypothetical protein SAMN04488244_10933 [Vibrio hangzhouensis]|uniref:Uncharacterized protein n=1 Tax=Vibrio hangzhouensis TaxID=462991 RepID=A0A1H5YDK9_9VIBR|nr:hypothetical protein SAMN04488244_10933 [Vibrio hangzhouensis]